MLHNILVVGGNGFIGSAVCKAALARGMNVTSISSSGRPYKTPKGHSPAWTSKVNWLAADAFNPSAYAELLPATTAVVHTLGTLLEDNGYKTAVKEGNPVGVLRSLARSYAGVEGNPLKEKSQRSGTYEQLNRDVALTVCGAFSTSKNESSNPRRPFVYISAEDVFRPFIPQRYITTKRQAERGIAEMVRDRSDFRAAFVRPSFVYQSHIRPMTTPIATLLDLSSVVHKKIPQSIPTPSSMLRALAVATSAPETNRSQTIDLEFSPFSSIANGLTIPPIHVDHVAEAICKVILDESVEGVVGVGRMRELIGWADKGNDVKSSPSNS